jgi:hypothetical protein
MLYSKTCLLLFFRNAGRSFASLFWFSLSQFFTTTTSFVRRMMLLGHVLARVIVLNALVLLVRGFRCGRLQSHLAKSFACVHHCKILLLLLSSFARYLYCHICVKVYVSDEGLNVLISDEGSRWALVCIVASLPIPRVPSQTWEGKTIQNLTLVYIYAFCCLF